MPQRREPPLWPRVKDETRIERALESCEKENRSLKALVVHLSEMVIRHIAGKKKVDHRLALVPRPHRCAIASFLRVWTEEEGSMPPQKQTLEFVSDNIKVDEILCGPA